MVVFLMVQHQAILVIMKYSSFFNKFYFPLGLDWSHQNSNLSGIASRIPNSMNGLFHHQYVWPCSISDSNMGILCIETNCDKRSYYKL